MGNLIFLELLRPETESSSTKFLLSVPKSWTLYVHDHYSQPIKMIKPRKIVNMIFHGHFLTVVSCSLSLGTGYSNQKYYVHVL